MKIGRRSFLPLAGVGLASAYVASSSLNKPVPRPGAKSPVVILKAKSYREDLTDVLTRGITESRLDVRGKRILLKPNLVEFDRATCINTDPRLVAAAVEVFEKLGAAEVLVGEGPGHRRDTWDLAELAGYREIVPGFDARFVDLNRDDVSAVPGLLGLKQVYLPDTILGVDLIISMAKMKTHHWAGATLSMKNFFGVVPGAVYGWPKNHLHFFGIDRSVIDLAHFFAPKSFGIVDGIIGMEGNGPIQGTPRHAGVVAFGRDLAAVDATCCRVMGIDPNKIEYLAGSRIGNVSSDSIEQRGEAIASVRQDFALIPEFRQIRGE